MKEFAAKGFEGARTGAIARRARVSESLLFYYFGSKEGNFRASFEQRQTRPGRWNLTSPDEVSARLVDDFNRWSHDLDWIRFLLWKA